MQALLYIYIKERWTQSAQLAKTSYGFLPDKKYVDMKVNSPFCTKQYLTAINRSLIFHLHRYTFFYIYLSLRNVQCVHEMYKYIVIDLK